ncbi:pyruvate, phosphate dikinase [Patescibacteria group bacterium]
MASSSSSSSKKSIYSFDEGDKSMKELLGGKGANLSEMTKLGIPVPFGFTITTEVCETFLKEGRYPDDFAIELEEKLDLLEIKMGKKFGDTKDPLLVSVRSGAAVSMPGMMDTILNLGLNDQTVVSLSQKTDNPRFAYDAYRRFLQMFSDVVLDVNRDVFEEEIEKLKEKEGISLDTELTEYNLKELVLRFKEIIKEKTGEEFPDNPLQQLKHSIEAVFKSWNNDRAIAYRRMSGIHKLNGTGVNVQAMVFGNMGEDSGTGVAFTRDPSTGEKVFYGEFLLNAQGEDVVAGIRTPLPISELEKKNKTVYEELVRVKDNLEKHYRDMQDIEFTIEKGKLYILQTRNGKRTAQAAIRIACEMVKEKLIDKNDALMKIEPDQLNQLLHPQIRRNIERDVIAKGLPASPGAACGKVVFTAERAVELAQDQNDKVILVRKETSPEDITGMYAAEGILTSRGGMTSHAAVVCRGMGKSCVVGCTDIIVNVSAKKMIAGDLVVTEGDIITLDGNTGEVMLGEMEMQQPELTGNFKTIMEWADEVRKLKVRTNADTPEDCEVAIKFGAEGIGLCRTEHMFFEEDRIHLIRKTILSKDEESRIEPLKKLKKIQKGDFQEIFKIMGNRPVTVRLLDPPLHEFLPDTDIKIEQLAQDFGMSFEELKEVIDNMHEINPMLGHRGCRLGITFPDIYRMQVQAITEAAMEASSIGARVNVEIEMPLIGTVNELKNLKDLAQKVILEYGEEVNFDYKIGTMIEIPRACLTADEIAKEADFFSFGTNDLTQMTYGFSRDDIGRFVPDYLEKGILERDPMAGIDQNGVGRLMKLCIELGRKEKNDLEIGICGEQGGDPESVEFCHNIGLNYVSCSPYRVPIARLAAAQAVLKK